jgi:hypothetical protein
MTGSFWCAKSHGYMPRYRALACSPAKAGVQTGLPPSRENKEVRASLAFELAHQHAYGGVDVAVRVAQFLDLAHRMDYRRVIAATEFAANLGE